jgi:hypothetical protein
VPVKSGFFQAKLRMARRMPLPIVACLQQSVLRRAHNESDVGHRARQAGNGRPRLGHHRRFLRLCESRLLF